MGRPRGKIFSNQASTIATQNCSTLFALSDLFYLNSKAACNLIDIYYSRLLICSHFQKCDSPKPVPKSITADGLLAFTRSFFTRDHPGYYCPSKSWHTRILTDINILTVVPPLWTHNERQQHMQILSPYYYTITWLYSYKNKYITNNNNLWN